MGKSHSYLDYFNYSSYDAICFYVLHFGAEMNLSNNDIVKLLALSRAYYDVLALFSMQRLVESKDYTKLYNEIETLLISQIGELYILMDEEFVPEDTTVN